MLWSVGFRQFINLYPLHECSKFSHNLPVQTCPRHCLPPVKLKSWFFSVTIYAFNSTQQKWTFWKGCEGPSWSTLKLYWKLGYILGIKPIVGTPKWSGTFWRKKRHIYHWPPNHTSMLSKGLWLYPRCSGWRRIRPFCWHKAASHGYCGRRSQALWDVFVNQRWLGGMLTNFQTLRRSINQLKNWKRRKQMVLRAPEEKEIVLMKRAGQIGKIFERH